MQLQLQEVAEILGSGAITRSAVCNRYSTDSRRIEPGDLFFAIPGPNFDGHDFVAEVLEKGAVGAVVREGRVGGYPESLRPSLLGVKDTTRALQELGQAVRRKWSGPLVAVTGSIGKTTTKEMIASVLGVRLSVLKSPGNLNNELGSLFLCWRSKITIKSPLWNWQCPIPGKFADWQACRSRMWVW